MSDIEQRMALGVAYDGSHYSGWQAQATGVASVQQELEQAISRVLDTPVRVVCAGRTDAGVHAAEQIVHLDTNVKRPEKAWTLGINSHLSHRVNVLWYHPVQDTFHARFSALARRYRYVIYNDPAKPVFSDRQMTWVQKPLDVHAMQIAADYLVGEHDFSAFRAAHCQSKTAKRCIYHIKVIKMQPLVVVDIMANAFLYKMVRNIVGVLLKIGHHEQPSHWAQAVLTSLDRSKAAHTAKPYGLYLVQVIYPECFHLPKRKIGPYLLGNIDDEYDEALVNARPWRTNKAQSQPL